MKSTQRAPPLGKSNHCSWPSTRCARELEFPAHRETSSLARAAAWPLRRRTASKQDDRRPTDRQTVCCSVGSRLANGKTITNGHRDITNAVAGFEISQWLDRRPTTVASLSHWASIDLCVQHHGVINETRRAGPSAAAETCRKMQF